MTGDSQPLRTKQALKQGLKQKYLAKVALEQAFLYQTTHAIEIEKISHYLQQMEGLSNKILHMDRTNQHK